MGQFLNPLQVLGANPFASQYFAGFPLVQTLPAAAQSIAAMYGSEYRGAYGARERLAYLLSRGPAALPGFAPGADAAAALMRASSILSSMRVARNVKGDEPFDVVTAADLGDMAGFIDEMEGRAEEAKAAEEKKPEEPVDQGALFRELGIDPAKYEGMPLHMKRSWRRLLEKGLTGRFDWRAVNAFARAESPDDSGLLAGATFGIPHEIKRLNAASAEEIGAYGETHASLPQFIDPRRGRANRIRVAVARICDPKDMDAAMFETFAGKKKPKMPKGRTVGASVLTIDHERMHATAPGERPKIYHVEYMNVPEAGRLDEIYESVHFNFMQDEVPAFMIMLRRAEIHRLRTGEDMLEMEPEKIFKDSLEKLKRALAEGGKEQMRRTIAGTDGYLAYKVAAFYMSVLWKFGVREFPDAGEFIDEIGITKNGMNREKAGKFYREKFMPLFKAHGINMIFRLLALSHKERAKVNELLGFLQGGGEGGRANMADFLRDKFDGLVPVFGRILGDAPSSVEEVDTHDMEHLPSLENPRRKGLSLRTVESPKIRASEIEIAGRFAGLLWKVHEDTPHVLTEHPAPYMKFAERSDPSSAAKIYSVLVHLARQDKLCVSDTWQLAYSLKRFGYETHGDEIKSIAMRRLKEEDNRREILEPSLPLENGWLGDLKELFAFVKGGLSKNPEAAAGDDAEMEEMSSSLAELLSKISDEDNLSDSESVGESIDFLDRMAPSVYARYVAHAMRHANSHPKDLDPEFAGYMIPEVEAAFEDALSKGMSKLAELRSALPGGMRPPGGALVDEIVAAHIRSNPELMKRPVSPFADKKGADDDEAGIIDFGGPKPLDDIYGTAAREADIFGGMNFTAWHRNPSSIAVACLTTAPFYALGLRFIDRLPDGIRKLSLFEIAAANLPDDAGDDLRLDIFEKYSSLLERCGPALAAWGYAEDLIGRPAGVRRAARKALDYDFKETHLFARHSAVMARLLFGGKSEGLKEKGLEILRGIPSEKKIIENQFSREMGRHTRWQGAQMKYNLSEGSAMEILSIADAIPPEHREAMLRLVFERLKEFEGAPEYNLFLELAGWAGEFGLAGLADEIFACWDRILAPAVNAAIAAETSVLNREISQAQFDGANSRASILLPIYAVATGGSTGFGAQLKRIQGDRDRRRYGSHVVQDVIKYVSREGIAARLGISEDDIVELARQAIVRYVAEISDDWNLPQFTLMVDTLKDLAISDERLDGVFEYFIDMLTPSHRPILSGGNNTFIREAADAYKALDFLLQSERTPRSQEKVLSLLKDGSRAVKDDPKGDDAAGAIEALAILFSSLPGGSAFDPAIRSAIPHDPSDETFTDSLAALDRYRRGLPEQREAVNEISSDALALALGAAARAGDTERAREISGDIRKAIEVEVSLAMERIGIEAKFKSRARLFASLEYERSHAYVPAREFADGLLESVFREWQNRLTAGDHAMADVLYSIWAQTEDSDQVRGRAEYFFKGLSHTMASPETKRRIFGALAGTPFISGYVKRVWEDAVEDGDVRKENLVYDLTRPHFGSGGALLSPDTSFRMPSDALYAMAVESPRDIADRVVLEMDKFAKDPKGYRARPSDEAGVLVLLDSCAADFGGSEAFGVMSFGVEDNAASRWEANLSRLADAVAMQGMWFKPRGDDPSEFRLKRLFAKLKGVIGPKFGHYAAVISKDVPFEFMSDTSFIEGWQNARQMMSRIEGVRDPAKALSSFDNLMMLRRRASDRMNAEKFEMTEHIKDRSPQTQMAAARLFFQMPVGQQQATAKAMEGKGCAEANRHFAQGTRQGKFAQVLSYWQDMPEEDRRDLVGFQSDVIKSDRAEFVDAVRGQLKDHDGDIVEYIIDHLSAEPIGVGTVADVYKSRIPGAENGDDMEVAVKAIVPSKEREFLQGVEWVRGLRDTLEPYAGIMRGVAEMIEVIDMYLDIVDEELDLMNEARHANALGASAPDGVLIPHYFDALTREKLAVTSLIEGERYDAENPAHVLLAKSVLFPFMSAQIMQGGPIPLDLQPGNLIIAGAGTMAGILDHGQTLYLFPEETELLKEMSAEILEVRADDLAKTLEGMGETKEDYNPGRLRTELSRMFSDGEAADIGNFLSKIFSICRENGLAIDMPFRKLGKGLATLAASATLKNRAEPGLGPPARFDEADRSELSAAIFASDGEGARRVMKRVIGRIEEHTIAVGWRNARQILCEFIADVGARVGGKRAPALKDALSAAAKESGVAINAANVMEGRYLRAPLKTPLGSTPN